VNFEEEV
jgi:hypothetical protein